MPCLIWFGALCEIVAVGALAVPPVGAIRLVVVVLLLAGVALVAIVAALGLADAVTARAEPFTAASVAEARATLARANSNTEDDSV